jgi:hypothetical protein
MGREVKRIDLEFDWFERTREYKPAFKVWFGYILDDVACKACDEKGKTINDKECPLCYGSGKVAPILEPPYGQGWQMWEDTSEGSPISPVFKTAKQLAKWLEDNNASAMGSQTATASQWMAMIKAKSAPSGVMIGGKFMNGVEACDKNGVDK